MDVVINSFFCVAVVCLIIAFSLHICHHKKGFCLVNWLCGAYKKILKEMWVIAGAVINYSPYAYLQLVLYVHIILFGMRRVNIHWTPEKVSSFLSFFNFYTLHAWTVRIFGGGHMKFMCVLRIMVLLITKDSVLRGYFIQKNGGMESSFSACGIGRTTTWSFF